ncbi:MAG TPA: alkaline phosphatase D family protein [Rhizomicrobium sp.]|jgi:alkaline phosphatase D
MDQTLLDRRRLILRTGQLALASSLAAWPVLAQPAFRDDPFTLGVAAGDPWPDGFVIWTRLVPRPLEIGGGMPPVAVKVLWEVAEDEHFGSIVRTGETLARPELGHSVHIEVDGLKPRWLYWYRFHIPGGTASPAGTARTAPAPGTLPERVRLGVVGCQNYHAGYYTAYRHLSRESDLDAVFHYGDYIYETVKSARDLPARTVVGNEPYTLDDYRRRYAQYKTDPDLKAAHQAAAFIMTFDDHEVQNNWASQWDENGTPPEMFALRKLGAMQAWYEHMPVRKAQFPLNGLQKTMYRRLDYGRLMRMHVLDTRTYRDIQLCEADSLNSACRKTNGPEVTILGREQEAWLADGLTGEKGWNLIAQQVMVMPFDHRQSPGEPYGVRVDDWNGYPAARARMVEAIMERKLTNVVIATGDAHQHYVGTVPVRDQDPGGPAAATEFLATSISSAGDGGPVRKGFERALEFNPNLKLINDQRGYMTFDITPKAIRADLQVLDKVTVTDGQLSKLASFVVTPDQPFPHKA